MKRVEVTGRRGIVVAHRANPNALPQVSVLYGDFEPEEAEVARTVTVVDERDGEATEMRATVVGQIVDVESVVDEST